MFPGLREGVSAVWGRNGDAETEDAVGAERAAGVSDPLRECPAT